MDCYLGVGGILTDTHYRVTGALFVWKRTVTRKEEDFYKPISNNIRRPEEEGGIRKATSLHNREMTAIK